MRKTILFILINLLFFSCQEQSKIVSIGQKVPDYTFTEIVNQDKEEISLRELKGKVTILEFGASWCSPCIPALKKMDSLQKEFENEVQVVWVSTESKKRLQNFLNYVDVSVPVANDSFHRELFPYQIVPHSVIIDSKGIVRGITNPKNITKDLVRQLLKGDQISVDLKDDFKETIEREVNILARSDHDNYFIELRPFEEGKRGIELLKDFEGNYNGINIWTKPLDFQFKTLMGISSWDRVIYTDGLSADDFPFLEDHRFSLSIETSENFQGDWRELGVKFLNNHFDINARKGIDSTFSFILNNNDRVLKESTSPVTQFNAAGSVLKAQKIPISRLIDYLERFTILPIVDGTKLTQSYDIELDWIEQDFSDLQSQLERYGLKLEKSTEKIPIEVAVLYKKSSD